MKLFFELLVTTVSDIGERAIIKSIEKILSTKNIGDDCATIEYNDDFFLITTDMITQKTHIHHQMTDFQIGWFVTAINLSDIAAKGGRPLGVVLALGLPSTTSLKKVEEIMKGANACATKFNTHIIGGDTKENPELTLSGTAIGIVQKEEFMPRRGAQIGDIVAVTGTLGKAAAGYYALQQNINDPTLWKDLFEPHPRIETGQKLAKQQFVTSCMDLSDGVSSSLYQLHQMNKVGFEIDQDRLPIAHGLLNLKSTKTVDVLCSALHFGGDYELLLTLPENVFDKALKICQNTNTNLTKIGTVTKDKKIILISNHKKRLLPNEGYEHFKIHRFSKN